MAEDKGIEPLPELNPALFSRQVQQPNICLSSMELLNQYTIDYTLIQQPLLFYFSQGQPVSNPRSIRGIIWNPLSDNPPNVNRPGLLTACAAS